MVRDELTLWLSWASFMQGELCFGLLFTRHGGLMRNKSTFQMDPNILAAVSVDSVEAFWMCCDPKLHIV